MAESMSVKANDCYNLLQRCRNIVLTGAPGTGKTYMARQIAAKMIGCKAEELKEEPYKHQFGFVQFHPSYDYTDFVEGLRPVMGKDDGVGFRRQDGIFKEFCKAAAMNCYAGFDECWERLIEDVKAAGDKGLEIPAIDTGHRSIRYTLNTSGSLKANIDYPFSVTKKTAVYIYHRRPLTAGVEKTYKPDVIAYMKTHYDLIPYGAQQHNFVFVIDEINRGEMSKIFGELFFSIDPGYRGMAGKIQTQYQNLVDKGDIFADGFFVPSNVYIIGTMNDIDLNVESMDFAMRRRFVWEEVLPEDTSDGMGIAGEARKRMKALNEKIKVTEGLGSPYCIGGAYFKMLGTDNVAFDAVEVWHTRFEPLLKDYLRGIDDGGGKFDELKSAYDGESCSDKPQGTDDNDQG